MIEFEPATVETGNLRVAHGLITGRGPDIEPQEFDEVVDVSGKLVLPGLVSAHHHLYATLKRGAGPRAIGFDGEAASLRKFEEALDLDAVQAAAMSGGLEGLAAGTTTVFDLHASPRAVRGSLERVSKGLNDVGLRGVLGYQLTERWGAQVFDDGLAEAVDFAQKARGRFRSVMAAHGTQTLSDDSLRRLREQADKANSVLLMHLAEDPKEEKLSVDTYDKTPVGRLMHHGLVNDRTVLAQAVHVSWPDLSQVLGTGAWLAHCPRSNMATQTGVAPAGKFGVRACVGTDTESLDVLAEAQTAWFRARDYGQPIDVLRYLANGQRLASQVFGLPVGLLREGAAADVVIMDYRPPTPLDAQTLSAHVLNGFSSRQVEAVMIDGMWRLWARKPLGIAAADSMRHAQEQARAVWARMTAA